MKEFIDKLISELKEEHEGFINRYGIVGGNVPASIVKRCMNIVNELAEEYKEERTLDCDKLLFSYSDLLRRFQNAESTVICEFSGNISKETQELEAECEELLSQFKEILYSANAPQESEEEYKVSEMPTGWIPCSERLPEEKEQERTVYDPITLAEVDTERYMASDLVNVTVRSWDSDEIFVCDDCTVDGKWVNFNGEQYEVIAWMPLPAPYTEGE